MMHHNTQGLNSRRVDIHVSIVQHEVLEVDKLALEPERRRRRSLSPRHAPVWLDHGNLAAAACATEAAPSLGKLPRCQGAVGGGTDAKKRRSTLSLCFPATPDGKPVFRFSWNCSKPPTAWDGQVVLSGRGGQKSLVGGRAAGCPAPASSL